jgi:hypothetical protein
LVNLRARAPLLGSSVPENFVFVDADDTMIKAHGYANHDVAETEFTVFSSRKKV